MGMATAKTEARAPMATRSLPEIMASIFRDQLGSVKTTFPAKVTFFDGAKKTVEVQPQVVFEKDVEGNDITPVPIPGVPVVFPGVYWDVQPGETGLVLVGWLNMQVWLQTGNLSPPEDTGIHEVSSCCFLPGLWPFPAAQATTLDALTKVIPLDNGLLQLLLGDPDADETVIRGNTFLSRLNAILILLIPWVTAVSAATMVDGSSLITQLGYMQQELVAGDYYSVVYVPGAGP
jgi:hypothetical protein